MAFNTVQHLHKAMFSTMSGPEKKEVIRKGPHQPDLKPLQLEREPAPIDAKTGKPKMVRRFSADWYSKHTWLTACMETLRVYCFPCILFSNNPRETAWTKSGINDWGHLGDKCTKHIKSEGHMHSCLSLSLFGQTDIAESLSQAYGENKERHNAEVTTNRHVLSRIIECIKVCGFCELALRGHDEGEGSDNPGVFRTLVNFSSEMDPLVEKHLQNATVFKGTSATIQNELLSVMLEVCREHIAEEIALSNFVAVMSDDTTDISNASQNVVVFRYLVGKNVVERFWSFGELPTANAQTISGRVLTCLDQVVPVDKGKVIAQCYDGAPVMSGNQRGVQAIVREQYPNAHFIHCYAHQLNLVLEQSTGKIPEMRVFFANVSGFSSFFSRSPKRSEYLDKAAARKIPRAAATRWNFSSRILSTVLAHHDDLKHCFADIIRTWNGDSTTIREACGFQRLLEDSEFILNLTFLSSVFDHVDILYNQLQKRDIDGTFTATAIKNFTKNVQKERQRLPAVMASVYTKHGEPHTRTAGASVIKERQQRVLSEVCDIIIMQCEERFSYSGHMVAASLLDSSLFTKYVANFPAADLDTTAKFYPFLETPKLTSELAVIYKRDEFRQSAGALSILRLIIDNNLRLVFSEVLKLCQIIVTMPMSSAEAERSFSSLKRIKNFLRNTMGTDRLNSLAMLSMEKKLVRENSNFNALVIEKFVNQKERRANFLYR